MKHLLALLLLAACAVTAQGQTLKTLSYNTNGIVVYTGTNDLGFSNSLTVKSEVVIASSLGAFLFADLDGAKDIFFFDGGEVDAQRARINLGLYATNEAAVFAADRLWDTPNGDWGFYVDDDVWRAQPTVINTNAPTNTTNAVRWIDLMVGTNLYKIPLFQ